MVDGSYVALVKHDKSQEHTAMFRLPAAAVQQVGDTPDRGSHVIVMHVNTTRKTWRQKTPLAAPVKKPLFSAPVFIWEKLLNLKIFRLKNLTTRKYDLDENTYGLSTVSFRIRQY